MLRRITTIVVLIAVAGLYAVPLAAAIASSGMPDCCANGMCPRVKHETKSKSADGAMPDCDMSDQDSATTTACVCRVSSCATSEGNAIGIGYFVLQAPAKAIQAAIVSPLIGKYLQFAHTYSSVPEAPPPRNQLS